jgi:dephospho-CoA kinase
LSHENGQMKSLRVGLTGGLACGKSFVGRTLEDLGAHLIQADELGHRALAPNGEAYQPVIREFGQEILDGNGRIDRHRLAVLVFDKPDKLAKLNAIVHPAVHRLQESIEREFRVGDPQGMIVVEAAILIETGSYKRFDRLILVICSEEQQVERAMRREGAVEAVVRARLSRQMPIEDKRKFAQLVIDTSGTKENTLRQTEAVYEALRRIEP